MRPELRDRAPLVVNAG
ncbi:hypothetical protein [Streptomyces sp. NBC_01176]